MKLYMFFGATNSLNVYDVEFYPQHYWNIIKTNSHDNVLMVSKNKNVMRQ